jgi:protein SCO1/2
VAGILVVSCAFALTGLRPRLPVISELKPFSLTNHLAEPVGLGSIRGSICVANVVFSRCPTQCRKLSSQMQRIQADIPAGVRLLSLTADPEHDTPQVLRRYGEQYKTDASKWWFLTGPKKELYRLAIEDLKFTVIESGEPDGKLEDLFIHSPVFAILDRRGRVRAVVQGEAANAEENVLRIVRSLRLAP